MITGETREAVLNALHQSVTGELLRLIDGFYSNIEDGLFELGVSYRRRSTTPSLFRSDARIAISPHRPGESIRAFDGSISQALVRRRRVARGRSVNRQGTGSIDHADGGEEQFALLRGAADASRSARRSRQVEHSTAAQDVPISPRRVARAFVVSCRSLKLDHASIEIVQDLFSRFVLDGLGSIYGHCNLRLHSEGYATADEMGIASGA